MSIITEDAFSDCFCLPTLLASKLGYEFYGQFALVDQGWLSQNSIVSLLRAVKN